mmetsp:Transcript_18880/g.61742  ORF Transcript_18880/g.61742 Transcript_18880/m.61742 type:complete len:298 (-) Transcript_18880:72-965(-)
MVQQPAWFAHVRSHQPHIAVKPNLTRGSLATPNRVEGIAQGADKVLPEQRKVRPHVLLRRRILPPCLVCRRIGPGDELVPPGQNGRRLERCPAGGARRVGGEEGDGPAGDGPAGKATGRLAPAAGTRVACCSACPTPLHGLDGIRQFSRSLAEPLAELVAELAPDGLELGLEHVVRQLEPVQRRLGQQEQRELQPAARHLLPGDGRARGEAGGDALRAVAGHLVPRTGAEHCQQRQPGQRVLAMHPAQQHHRPVHLPLGPARDLGGALQALVHAEQRLRNRRRRRVLRLDVPVVQHL